MTCTFLKFHADLLGANELICISLYISPGSPMVGHVDHIDKLQEICQKNDMWLHLEGYVGRLEGFVVSCKKSYGNISLMAVHDDVFKSKRFPRSWPFVRGMHRSPVNSRLFKAQIEETIKAPHHWPLWGEFTVTGEFPSQSHDCEFLSQRPAMQGFDGFFDLGLK